MAEGWSAAAANSAIDALLAAYPWLQLHTGAPGASGAANVAAESTRKLVTFAGAAAGAATNSAPVQWPTVAGTETFTHVSGHSAASAGNFGWSGQLTSAEALRTVSAGDTFTIAAGDLDVILSVAS